MLSLLLDHHSCYSTTQSRCFSDRESLANFNRNVVTASHSLAVPAVMWVYHAGVTVHAELWDKGSEKEKSDIGERSWKGFYS